MPYLPRFFHYTTFRSVKIVKKNTSYERSLTYSAMLQGGILKYDFQVANFAEHAPKELKKHQ
ncbi:protein of unknown function [Petrocella atlantisensis]|uniref:Uncharacterized protein n=1 Tax=Petrocella atlantisensis TaxID=2173034 RepID=A0A3P7PGA0_9FIRM|nr:protein of unknown function [Petrocella atlantisensis]